MASGESVDAQFDRAVEIVQSLPKTGPIQTDYEEKLAMYSLYKQATVGNVNSPRPGMWDMLGRAKWDAWEKHKDLDSYEAKRLYVEALLKVLRKYSDKTTAKQLVQELESYGTYLSDSALNRTLSGSPDSDSSGSTSPEDIAAASYLHPSHSFRHSPHHDPPLGSNTASEDEVVELPMSPPSVHSQAPRPQSSLSSHRYRTPMTGSFVTSPPPHTIPTSQPMPTFQTPSAFAEPSVASSYPSGSSYVGQSSESFRVGIATPTRPFPLNSSNAHHREMVHPHSAPYGPARPASRQTLERAVENTQAHLAALSERLEALETSAISRSRISLMLGSSGSPGRRGSPYRGNVIIWDLDDMGLWSLVLNPLARGLGHLRDVAAFFARDDQRSPTAIIVRRLCLDVSFLLCVLAIIRGIWKRSGVRRREVKAALLVLWRAIIGSKPNRALVDRGIQG